MSQKKIKVTIDPMGNTVVEAENFAGQGCEAATQAIEKALSSGGVERVIKDEYYQAEETAEQHVEW
jgi:hypothetical protein